MNKFQWHSNRCSNIFIQENAFEIVVCEMASISYRPQCVNVVLYCTIDMDSVQLNSTHYVLFVAVSFCQLTTAHGGLVWQFALFMWKIARNVVLKYHHTDRSAGNSKDKYKCKICSFCILSNQCLKYHNIFSGKWSVMGPMLWRKCHVKSMFISWLLIGCRQCRQSIRIQVWKFIYVYYEKLTVTKHTNIYIIL